MRCHVIGPSGHKSEYHCATLLGNWQEERKSFGHKDPAREPLSDKTLYKDSYKGTSTEEELLNAKPPSCFHENALPELLFYHDKITAPSKRFMTVSELSYTDVRKGEVNSLHDILHKEGSPKRRERADAIHRGMGITGHKDGSGRFQVTSKGATAVPLDFTSKCCEFVDQAMLEATRNGDYKPPVIPPVGRLQEKNRFLTTKNVTHDITGEFLKTNIDCYPATSSKAWGTFMKFTDSMKGKKLREYYED
uniref:Uncharacterized protein TCIL3000_4_2720 n=1 Tax=Trypanosoma congolense (strain IL3000) TaxID=1068625 RepID=G0ULC6_TRYCI|nr:unnamed protein product [Trypanosoma congolense IL3000]